MALWQRGWLERQPLIILEPLALMVLAWIVASSPKVSRDILALPDRTRLALLALTGFVVFAQMVGGGGDVFPGARWAMFSDEVAEPDILATTLVTDDGEEHPLEASELFGALRNGRAGSMSARLDESTAEALMSAYIERFEELNPGVSVIEIRVRELTLDGDVVVAISETSVPIR